MSGTKVQRKSRALLIFVENFHHRSGLLRRGGAKADANKLFKVLSRLDFKVTLCYDKTAREICDIYRKESSEEQGDFFLSVLSSHGEEGLIYGFDGCPVKLTDLFKALSPQNCPALTGKTKMFFVQACRGQLLDPGVELQTDSAEPQEDSFTHYLAIPHDTAVMFASSPGYPAFLNLSGAFFLQTLCTLLQGEERHLELSRLMTRISHTVAYRFQARGEFKGAKEMPCFITNMTQEVYPFSRLAREEQAARTEDAPPRACNLHPEGSRGIVCSAESPHLLRKQRSVEAATQGSATDVGARNQLNSLHQMHIGTVALKGM